MTKRSDTTKKQPGGITGKGFTAGDPRINRNGRPRKAEAFREMLESKWDEPAVDKNGNRIQINGKQCTYGDVVVERLFRDSKQTVELLNRMFGKITDNIEHDGEIILKVVYGERD